jgi:16S rRNA (cytosine967-C5)-methyltransferase
MSNETTWCRRCDRFSQRSDEDMTMNKQPSFPAHITARTVAAFVVGQVLDGDRWSQPALHDALHRSRLDGRERALCTELAYGTLRHARALEASLLRSADKPDRGLDARMRPHLLVAAYQLHHLAERIPAHAVVDEAVNAVGADRPGLRGFANALLRRLGSAPATTLRADANVKDIAKAYGVPLWLAEVMTGGGDDRREAIAALCARPNTFAVQIGDAVVNDEAHAFVPRVHRLAGGRVEEVDGFDEGRWLVMDPGSVTCARLVGAQPGWTVLDLCAAPGGKTMLLADAVGPAGRVIAVEKSAPRAKSIHHNAARLRLTDRITVVVADALDEAAIAAHMPSAGFDAVLLDAPCTGLGTTRRKPEILLRRTLDDVAAATGLQQSLLRVAARLVRPGGTLVYSVCSPMPAEGEHQLRHFDGLGLELEGARTTLPWLPATTVDSQGAVQLRPHRDDADAFFMVRSRRR